MPAPTTFNLERSVIAIQPLLMNYAMKLTKNIPQAEDLVQDTIIRVYENINQFTPGTRFESWVIVILRNLFLSSFRKGYTRNIVLDEGLMLAHQDPSANPERMLIASDEYKSLQKALEVLPQNQRQIVLSIANGRSYVNASRRFGIAEGTVKSRVKRARDSLGKMMDRPRGRDFSKKADQYGFNHEKKSATAIA